MTKNARRGRLRRAGFGGSVAIIAATLALVTQVPQAAATAGESEIPFAEPLRLSSVSAITDFGEVVDVPAAPVIELRETLEGVAQVAVGIQRPPGLERELVAVVAGTGEVIADPPRPLVAVPAGGLAATANLESTRSQEPPAGPASALNGRVTGTVRDAETGAPIASAQVYLAGTNRGALSTATGTFTLDQIPPGTYELIANRVGYMAAGVEELLISSGVTATLELRMTPAATAPAPAAGTTARITGFVRDSETGAPINNARISLDDQPYGALSGMDGAFTLPMVAPGTRSVRVQRIGYTETRLTDVTVAADSERVLEISVAPVVPTLQGTVSVATDVEGNRSQISITRADRAPNEPVNGVRSPIAIARVDRALVAVPVDRQAPAAYTDVRLQRSDAAERNGQITGTVKDARTGSPLEGVQIFVVGSTIAGLTSATGTYRLVDVPPGTYTLTAMRTGYDASRVEQVDITAGSITSLNFLLAPTVDALQENTRSRPVGNPLIVVDGVIIGNRVPSTIDIESLDIESIEVIRGQAASQMYGSRARDGVINIRLKTSQPADTPAQQ